MRHLGLALLLAMLFSAAPAAAIDRYVPMTGGLAELVGLRAALALVVACLTVAALLARAVRTPAAARSR